MLIYLLNALAIATFARIETNGNNMNPEPMSIAISSNSIVSLSTFAVNEGSWKDGIPAGTSSDNLNGSSIFDADKEYAINPVINTINAFLHKLK